MALYINNVGPRSFWKERAVAGGILVGLATIVAGMELVRLTASSIDTNGHINNPTFHAADVGVTAGLILVGLGSAIALFFVLLGLAAAFGFAPNFLARRVVGAAVEERFILSGDGAPLLDAEPDGDSRCYLRLRFPNGEVAEGRCSVATYNTAYEGATGTVRLIGERMVSFDITSKRRI